MCLYITTITTICDKDISGISCVQFRLIMSSSWLAETAGRVVYSYTISIWTSEFRPSTSTLLLTDNWYAYMYQDIARSTLCAWFPRRICEFISLNTSLVEEHWDHYSSHYSNLLLFWRLSRLYPKLYFSPSGPMVQKFIPGVMLGLMTRNTTPVSNSMFNSLFLPRQGVGSCHDCGADEVTMLLGDYKFSFEPTYLLYFIWVPCSYCLPGLVIVQERFVVTNPLRLFDINMNMSFYCLKANGHMKLK